MAEPTAQQIARQRLAATDLSKFAPQTPKRKKSEPEPTKYTTPKVQLAVEERAAKKKAYNHDYYLSHKEEKKELEAKRRAENPGYYRSNSLRWYYAHHEEQCAKHRDWYRNNKERKTEYMREWRKKHPGYFSKKAKEERKNRRNNDTTENETT